MQQYLVHQKKTTIGTSKKVHCSMLLPNLAIVVKTLGTKTPCFVVVQKYWKTCQKTH